MIKEPVYEKASDSAASIPLGRADTGESARRAQPAFVRC